jgi:hypothetical protein
MRILFTSHIIITLFIFFFIFFQNVTDAASSETQFRVLHPSKVKNIYANSSSKVCIMKAVPMYSTHHRECPTFNHFT